jgi:hypothetical protein
MVYFFLIHPACIECFGLSQIEKYTEVICLGKSSGMKNTRFWLNRPKHAL